MERGIRILKSNKRTRVKVGVSTDIFKPTTPRMITDHPPTLRQEPQSADTGNPFPNIHHVVHFPRVSSNRTEPAGSETQDPEPNTRPSEHYLQNAPHFNRNRQPCKSIEQPRTLHEKEGPQPTTNHRIRPKETPSRVLPKQKGSHAEHEREGVTQETGPP